MAITAEMLAKKKIRVRNQINRMRDLRHIPPVELNEALSAIAQAHAEDMSERWYYDVVSPEGKTGRDRIIAAGLTPRYYGEVVVAGQLSVAYHVVRGFLGDLRYWNARVVMQPALKRVGLGRAAYWIDEPRTSIWCALLTT